MMFGRLIKFYETKIFSKKNKNEQKQYIKNLKNRINELEIENKKLINNLLQKPVLKRY